MTDPTAVAHAWIWPWLALLGIFAAMHAGAWLYAIWTAPRAARAMRDDRATCEAILAATERQNQTGGDR